MIEFENKTNFNLNIHKLENIKNSLTDKIVELILTDDEEIKKINKEYRNKNSATDVLSFPINNMQIAGTIIISIDTAKKASQEFSHSIEEEITLLFIHGLLHLLGYDHEVDNGEMREKEEEIIQKFNLPKSLIIRNN